MIQFDMDKTARKIMEKLQESIDKQSGDPKEIISDGSFPISIHTWYKYKAFINEKANGSHIKSMKISTLFDICQYTNTSADYMLGFKPSPYQWFSEKNEDIDFGFDSQTMAIIKKINQQEPFAWRLNGDTIRDMDFLNFIIKYFFQELENSTLQYMSCLYDLKIFEKHNINHKTGNIKIDGISDDEINELTNRYQCLKDEIDEKKFKVVQTLYRFLDRVWSELSDDNK